MSDFRSESLPERNPVTHQIHRRQVLWQITVPLILGIVVMIVLCVLAAAASRPATARWSEISTIWLIIPTMFFSLILLVIVGGLAFGIIWLIGKLPPLFRRLQDIFLLVNGYVRAYSDKAVAPVMKANEWNAQAQLLRRKISRKA